MSAFSDLDASDNVSELLAYLDDTDRSLSAMKAYVAALATHYAHSEPVLDLGCGVGHDLARLAGAGARPVGVDISAQALSRARVFGFPVVIGDGSRLPFANGAFAGCRVERVLQHVTDPAVVLDEVVRVTRPSGFIAVFEPDHTSFRVDSDLVPDGTLPGRFVSVRHPGIGAQVADLLRARGCVVVDVITETSFGYRLDALPFDAAKLTQRGVDTGALDPGLRAAWLDEQQVRVQDGRFQALWSKILTVARTHPATARMD
jgi:SAM-dependent methyltransferase